MITWQERFQQALQEDMPTGDITTELIYHDSVSITAHLMSKSTGIFCGEEVIRYGVSCYDNIELVYVQENGDQVCHGTCIGTLRGDFGAIMGLERVLLNSIQRLSGIATVTNAFVQALHDPAIAIMDTRKTTPLWRDLEKRAVRVGGGQSHRHHLSDMVLLKDNHLAYLRHINHIATLPQWIKAFKRDHPTHLVELEIGSQDDLAALALDDIDIVMLDNFSPQSIPDVVKQCREKGYDGLLEVSGAITLETIANYRHMPIDRISVGRLTHSVPAMDISLQVMPC